MDIAQPPRRKAAIKATTQLTDISSSDGDHAAGDESRDYVAAQRVKRPKSGRGGKGKRSRSGKHSTVDSVDPRIGVSRPNVGKRKRDVSIVVHSSRKRQCGSDHDESIHQAKDSDDEESDLTPLSSEDEREGSALMRPLTKFPLQFTPPGPRLTQEPGNSKLKNLPPLEIPDVDDDSDDLPDVGMVLSQQQDVSSSRSQKYNTSTRRRKSNARPRHTNDNSPYSPTSSPTLPPTLSPSSSILPSRRDPPEDDTRTEVNLSDLDDDSDLELNSVAVGELCLAKAKATEAVYWPAKVLHTKRLLTRKGREKKIYHIMFLDKKEKEIPRDWFYTYSQDEFGTCTVGHFESSHVEVVNDIDEESRKRCTLHSRRHQSPPVPRSPSPITIPSPPLSGPEYCQLPLRQQFGYVIPVLRAIMNEEYTWGLRRHELYMKGGASRLKLMNEGGLRGAVDARSVDELMMLVEIWCLGCQGRHFVGDEDEEQRAESQPPGEIVRGSGEETTLESVGTPSGLVPQKLITEVHDPSKDGPQVQVVATEFVVPEMSPHSKVESLLEGDPTELNSNTPPTPLPPPSPLPSTQPVPEFNASTSKSKPKRTRQHGSPAYETLLPLEKVQYCIEVLLPETLNQILLWRTGERKSVEVMWGNVEEEKRLHERGEQLLRKTDWVMDIMRLRRALESTKEKKSAEDGVVKSKSKDLRRTRSGRFGGVVGSYKE